MQPKQVVRVMHAHRWIEKPEYRAEHGPWIHWPTDVASMAGSVIGDAVVLSEEAVPDRPSLDRASAVMLNDWVAPPPTCSRSTGFPWYHGGGAARYEIFSLQDTDAGLELHLHGGRHNALLGRPGRPDMRLAILRPGSIVRVSVNGRHDGHHQRMYAWFDYIFVHLGRFEQFEVRPAGWRRPTCRCRSPRRSTST
jgi:hypothetical protein